LWFKSADGTFVHGKSTVHTLPSFLLHCFSIGADDALRIHHCDIIVIVAVIYVEIKLERNNSKPYLKKFYLKNLNPTHSCLRFT